MENSTVRKVAIQTLLNLGLPEVTGVDTSKSISKKRVANLCSTPSPMPKNTVGPWAKFCHGTLLPEICNINRTGVPKAKYPDAEELRVDVNSV